MTHSVTLNGENQGSKYSALDYFLLHNKFSSINFSNLFITNRVLDVI